MGEIQEKLRVLLIKDLRNQCRARGLNPGGSREALAERIEEHMNETGDLYVVGSIMEGEQPG